MSEITIRSIAAEASCSVGLAYRYFETKDELIGAVLDRAAVHITQDMTPDDTFTELANKAWRRMEERPVFARLVAHLILEQADVTEVMSGHPFARIVVAQSEASGDPDPVAGANALAALVLGTGLYVPTVARAIGDPTIGDRAYGRLASAAEAVQRTDESDERG